MTRQQSEAMLEEKLINQLVGQGYEKVVIKGEKELISNFRKQLGKHNDLVFSDAEFKQVMDYLGKPTSIFDKAEALRDRVSVKLDNGDKKHIEFFNQEKWCQNIFQVSNQITMINPENKIENRYDVTILINGLPMVQIELKRRGVEVREAYNQTIRYNHQTMHGLFGFIQIFVISNGVNTKYYANSKDLKNLWKQTINWTDENNNVINNIEEFAETFLEKCHIAKMIIKYIVLNNGLKCLMVLRPYQYYAVERLIERVENTNKNGYIWHTTGSGKTLTSFKASQILAKTPGIYKVLFVVDRNDLNTQTLEEFNKFEEGSVDGTDNTNELVKHLGDPTKPLLITTIQKLNNAISKLRHSKKMEAIKDEKFVFIFDECHRSQFGDTNKRIKEYFTNHQMFGFTGTPILEKNAIKDQTTKSLFGDRLHKYTIKDAIKDEKVLGFSVEYISTHKQKEDDSEYEVLVEDIDRKEVFEAEERLEKIVRYIRSNHDRKTYGKKYQSIFSISDIKTLIKYYDIFKREAPELKVATIFSFAANENKIVEKLERVGNLESNIDMDNISDSQVDHDSRDALERFMKEYGKEYGGQFSLNVKDGYSLYFKNVAENLKNRKIDILLVVNMFLTGFDSKSLNTLYVDKNLRYHGLIQAFSRTNRILNEEKSHGNVVCFRNIKRDVDEAITLYSDGNASEDVLMKPYEEYLNLFKGKLEELRRFTPTIESVDSLESEDQQGEFIKIFRELIRLKTKLSVFTNYDTKDLNIDINEYNGYQSKYIDMYNEVSRPKGRKDKVSILDDINFEIELLFNDKINVKYILMLLSKLNPKGESFKKDRERLLSEMDGDPKLKSKRELIEEFIDSQLDGLNGEDEVIGGLEEFLEEKRKKMFYTIVEDEQLHEEKVMEFINEYEYSGRKLSRQDTKKLIENSFMEGKTLKFLAKREKRKNVLDRIVNYIEKFDFEVRE